jgi:hypothetical protein
MSFDVVTDKYQIAMRRFVDNVAILVVEMTLLDDLEEIFSPSVVADMSDEQLHVIAGESRVVEQQRQELDEKKEGLEDALRTCYVEGMDFNSG